MAKVKQIKSLNPAKCKNPRFRFFLSRFFALWRVWNVSQTFTRFICTDNKLMLMLTSSLMYNIAISGCDGCENERVIVLCRFIVCVTVTDAIPRILLHVDVSLFDVTVFRQKVFSQHQGKVFWRFDAEFFRQQIDGVLLRIGCNNVRVITCAWNEMNKNLV